MTAKERVATALMFEEPDRIPVSALFVPEMQEKLRRHLNLSTTAGNQSPALANDLVHELGIALGNDMIKVQTGMENMFYVPGDEEYTTDWGVVLKRVENSTGVYTENIRGPLQGDDSLLDSYEIPDPLREDIYIEPARVLQKYGQEYWVVGSVQISIFEAAAHLRGLPEIMMDMMVNKDYANRLLDKVMQFPLQAGKRFIEMGVDMVWCGDDVAMQNTMMISLETWREFFKPRYALLFTEYRKIRPDIKICYHSDGNCEAILDDMIEIGLDVINPIQPLSMDPVHIKKRYGKKLAMFGGVDIQYTMPFGSMDELENEIKTLCYYCGRGGGYILSPSHYLQSDVSVDKVLKFYEFARKYGRYA